MIEGSTPLTHSLTHSLTPHHYSLAQPLKQPSLPLTCLTHSLIHSLSRTPLQTADAPRHAMLSENILREDKSPTANPLAHTLTHSHGGTDIEMEAGSSERARTSSLCSQVPLRPDYTPRGSDAYRMSLQRNNSLRAGLAAEGRGAGSYEFKDLDDPEAESLPAEVVSKLPPAEKLRLIGRKTVCMAAVLTCFGIGMMVTSFFFIRQHLNDRGFLLFFLIGLCALLPGCYACYNILGKFLGW